MTARFSSSLTASAKSRAATLPSRVDASSWSRAPTACRSGRPRWRVRYRRMPSRTHATIASAATIHQPGAGGQTPGGSGRCRSWSCLSASSIVRSMNEAFAESRHRSFVGRQTDELAARCDGRRLRARAACARMRRDIVVARARRRSTARCRTMPSVIGVAVGRRQILFERIADVNQHDAVVARDPLQLAFVVSVRIRRKSEMR